MMAEMVQDLESFGVFGLVDHYIFHCKVGFTTALSVVSCPLYRILIGRSNHGIMHYDLLPSLTSGHDTTDDLAVTRL